MGGAPPAAAANGGDSNWLNFTWSVNSAGTDVISGYAAWQTAGLTSPSTQIQLQAYCRATHVTGAEIAAMQSGSSSAVSGAALPTMSPSTTAAGSTGVLNYTVTNASDVCGSNQVIAIRGNLSYSGTMRYHWWWPGQVAESSCPYGVFSVASGSYIGGKLQVVWRWRGDGAPPTFLVRSANGTTTYLNGAAVTASPGVGYYSLYAAATIATDPGASVLIAYKTGSETYACEVTAPVGTAAPVVPGEPDAGDVVPPDGDGTSEGGASCGAWYRIACHAGSAIRGVFVPSQATQDGWSELGGDVASRVPWGYLTAVSGFWSSTLEYAETCAGDGCGDQGFSVAIPGHGSIDILGTDQASSASPGMALLRQIRPVLSIVVWASLLVPLAFWLFRKLVPGTGGGE